MFLLEGGKTIRFPLQTNMLKTEEQQNLVVSGQSRLLHPVSANSQSGLGRQTVRTTHTLCFKIFRVPTKQATETKSDPSLRNSIQGERTFLNLVGFQATGEDMWANDSSHL